MWFYYEDDADVGQIDIYAGFLGVDSASVSGTGNLASLVFTTLVSGQSTVSFTTESRFADPLNNPIEILLSLIHISEPPRQEPRSYGGFSF